jgi:hypothetical protein
LSSAKIIATALLRSSVYREKLVGLWEDHMDANKLTELVQRNDLFVIDKTRRMNLLNAPSVTLTDYDPWKIYINSLLLLELQDTERESIEK